MVHHGEEMNGGGTCDEKVPNGVSERNDSVSLEEEDAYEVDQTPLDDSRLF